LPTFFFGAVFCGTSPLTTSLTVSAFSFFAMLTKHITFGFPACGWLVQPQYGTAPCLVLPVLTPLGLAC
jgi:hypothetical protein